MGQSGNMESVTKLAEKIIDNVLLEGGFVTLILFIVCVYFAYLYFNERKRNVALTDQILANTNNHADRFVGMVTDGIEADNRLSLALSQLATIINELKHGIEARADSGKHSYRR